MTEKQKYWANEWALSFLSNISCCIQHFSSFNFTLTPLDLWEISNVNCDGAISLCQSGHHQWHFKLIFPLREGVTSSEESGFWRAEKGQDADWGFDWSVSLKSTAIQNRIDSLQRNLLGGIARFILINRLEMKFNSVLLHAHKNILAHPLTSHLPRLPYVICGTEKKKRFLEQQVSVLAWNPPTFLGFSASYAKRAFTLIAVY